MHAPKTPKRGVNQVPEKLTSSIAFFKSLQSGLPMNLINTPMPRVSCRNDENPEIFFQFFSQDFHPWHEGVYKVHGKSQLQGFKKRYGGS